MKEKGLNTLLVKFFTKSISEDEEKELIAWVNKSEFNATIFKKLKSIWKERSQEQELVNSDSLIDEIWSKGVNGNQRSINRAPVWIYRVAAVIVIFLVAGFLVTRELHRQENLNGGEIELVTKFSPAGEKIKLVLAEGSIIYLNSGSEIRYNKNFSDTSRIIYLEGEAFFEVAHDHNRPFTVITAMSSTTALGTSFNINTQYDETDKIALFDGKVKVIEHTSGTQMLLAQGELGMVNSGNKVFEKTTFDKDIVGGWKDGILIFNAASFEDFKKKVELWYDVSVLIDGKEPHDWKLTAQYRRETLENILLDLQFQKDFRYEIENDTLTLKFE
ncbi:MAG: FecR family protein [Cytophagales bacterium]|nr:FecR family protein [Cytophagales bacterium]